MQPFHTPDQAPAFRGLDTADTLVIDHVLSDTRIIADLEKQFPSEAVQKVAEVSHSNRYSSINESMPGLGWAAQPVKGNMRVSLADTMAPGTLADSTTIELAEPDLPHGEARPFTDEESKVVLAALRKATHTAGYRGVATNILAEYAPLKLERTVNATTVKAVKAAADFSRYRRRRSHQGKHHA